jgi:signal transduction histidine kinase/CheY-like chemotaxis protein
MPQPLTLLVVATPHDRRLLFTHLAALTDQTSVVAGLAELDAFEPTCHPQVVLICDDPPQLDAVAVLERLQSRAWNAPRLVITHQGDPRRVADLMRQGASDCLGFEHLEDLPQCTIRALHRDQATRPRLWPGGEQERFFSLVARIRNSLDLGEIFNAAVSGVRALLKVDRALIYRFDADYNGRVVAESVGEGWTRSLAVCIPDTCFRETKAIQYANNRIVAFDDVRAAGLTPCHLELLERFEVRANLVVPILLSGQVWGLFILHQCSGSRHWRDEEIKSLYQVGAQLTIALQQAQLYCSSQAQIRELERLARLKDDFLSTVSHELRTPLTNIKVAVHLLKQLKIGAINSAYLEILESECEREIKLINDLLDLQRFDLQGRPVQAVPVSLSGWLASLVQPFRERARQQKQHLRIVGLEALPSVASLEPASVQRIVSELLHNACKYTPTGEQIAVSFASAQGQLHFEVRNTGVEIPAAEIDRIFERFYRVPGNDPWRSGGTGLGLALVRQAVTRLGGQIQAWSSAREVVFTVRLPLETLAASA